MGKSNEGEEIEKYKDSLKNIIDSIDNIHILKYFYKLIPKLLKEWQ